MLRIGLLILLITNILYSSNIVIASEDGSSSFIKNQKYICIFQKGFVDNKEVYVMSKEDAFKYPTRFYVNSNNILITDKGMRGNFIETGIYQNPDKKTMAWFLQVKSEKEKFLLVRDMLEGKEMLLFHACTWTDNWTLSK